MPVNSAEGDAACVEQLSTVMEKRLAFLDEVDIMEGQEGEADNRHVRYQFLRRKASKLMVYWQRAMPPRLTQPVMRSVVDPRLQQSLACLAKPEGSDTADQKRWAFEQPLPTTMGGADVGGTEQRCGVSFCASVLACSSRLLATPTYHGFDPVAADSGIFAEVSTEYEAVSKERLRIEKVYRGFDKHPYLTLRGGKQSGY